VTLSLEGIRDCLEGAIPSTVATCAPDGTPNVTYVSQVHFVDCSHVALSFQFFNKTRENVLANPRASALVIHPATGAQYRLELEYVRTEQSGALFENMKAKLAGIASHTGMSGVFRLLGSDVYRVIEIVAVPGKPLPAALPRRNPLSALRAFAELLTASTDLANLLEQTLTGLETHFAVRHAMILMADNPGKKLYTVASRGYAESGVGSEIAFGCGVIGVAAEHRTPIRISHMTAEYSYGRAIRESILRAGLASRLETAIPLPGLPDSRSQLAVPVIASRQLLGVLYVESPEDLRFSYDDEDSLVTIAGQLGAAIQAMQHLADLQETAVPSGPKRPPAQGTASTVRRYASDDSIFIDDDYLIKGVAGAIFWKLLRDNAKTQRSEFCNKELRLDPNLGLPDITDNLEARLILLERRLSERKAPMRIEKTGRGRFRVRIDRPYTLVEVS
jgi:putative methionine-R-sulfoxide reductase with GAF domain